MRQPERRPPASCGDIDAHGFALEIRIDRLAAEFTAPAGLLETAERHRRVQYVVAIHPDGAGAQLRGEPQDLADVPAPDAGREAVDRVVRDAGDVGQLVERLSHD